MDRIAAVLHYLRATGEHVSGDYIARGIGTSRTAVWKYINQLEHLGYTVSKLKGKGYRLTDNPNRLFPWEIKRHLRTRTIGNEILYHDEVDSTNTRAFRLGLDAAPEGLCVVAEAQREGRGRLGRIWYSPAGKNLYASVILRPPINPASIYPITFISSLAAYDTVEVLARARPALKWPNDVLLKGKKICGTLIELSTEADAVRFVIVGIGFNINVDMPEMDVRIRETATSLRIEAGKDFDRAAVCGMLLTNLEYYYRTFLEKGAQEICAIWQERAGIKGKVMEITQMGQSFKGISEGIDRDGALLLKVDGVVKRIVAGDVTV